MYNAFLKILNLYLNCLYHFNAQLLFFFFYCSTYLKHRRTSIFILYSLIRPLSTLALGIRGNEPLGGTAKPKITLDAEAAARGWPKPLLGFSAQTTNLKWVKEPSTDTSVQCRSTCIFFFLSHLVGLKHRSMDTNHLPAQVSHNERNKNKDHYTKIALCLFLRSGLEWALEMDAFIFRVANGDGL